MKKFCSGKRKSGGGIVQEERGSIRREIRWTRGPLRRRGWIGKIPGAKYPGKSERNGGNSETNLAGAKSLGFRVNR